MKSVYITDSLMQPEGHGGSVVSFHELHALQSVTTVRDVFQRLGQLLVEKEYPNNPFMYDYYIASLLTNPEEIELAQFYGAHYTVTMKVLHKAVKIATCSAHNLELSLDEWQRFEHIWGKPPVHLVDPFLFELGAQGLKECKVVICPSASSASYLTARFGLNNIVVLPHGTDLPSVWDSKRSEFVVFHLGQFGPDKGQNYLLDAWRKIELQKGRLLMACQNITGLSGTPPNCTVYGQISQSLKEELYAKAAVYVQPSVTEGWGLPVGEAMARGTPVIVTRGVGAADMVTDGEDGFIIPIRSVDAIAEKLKYFYFNPAEIERMGNNARKKAEQYDWKLIEQRYAKLVKEVAGI